MGIYVVKNEGGSQSFKREFNDSDNIIGLWKITSLNYTAIYRYVSSSKINQKSFYNSYLYYSKYVFLLKHLYKIKPKIVKNDLHIAIIKKIYSINRMNDYIRISSILKHFEETETPIHKQVILDMVDKKLLNKSSYKVNINEKGFNYIKNTNLAIQ